MDNKDQELSLQQQEEELQYSDIDRVKELFEYEMTEVLLGFKEEKVRFKRKDVSEYIDMELPKTDVDFSSSEIELKGIEYQDAKDIKPIETLPKDLQVSLPDSIEITQTEQISIKTGILKSIELEKPLAQDKDLKARTVSYVASDIEMVSSLGIPVDVPDIALNPVSDDEIKLKTSLIDTQVTEPKIFEPMLRTDLKEPCVDVPSAGKIAAPYVIEPVIVKGMTDIKGVNPNTTSVEYVSEPVIVKEEDLKVSVPKGKIDPNKIDAGKADDMEIRVSVPDIDISGLKADVRVNTIPPVIKSAAVEVEFTGSPVIDNNRFSIADVSLSEVKIDSPGEQNVNIIGIPEVKILKTEFPSVPECPDVSEYFKEAASEIVVKKAEPEYPEIPECPDFSQYYEDIIEAVRNSL